MRKILVTGSAGFIGFHLSQKLLNQGEYVIGLDNLNDYYDVSLKQARLNQLTPHPNFKFYHNDLVDRTAIQTLFNNNQISLVVHLAAQAGVRYSITNPYSYVDSNIVGFINILEACRHHQIEHLVYASSSSVYGANTKIPFATQDNVDHPVSLYAASKKANELMAHTYSHLYQIPTTGLRFFTVYGEWGRPDMAAYKFTQAILANQPIEVYNYGKMKRDFTYIDDIIEGVIRVMNRIPQSNPHWVGDHPDPSSSKAPYKIYNIGNNQPVELLRFIEILEECLGKKAQRNLLPLQPGDVLETYADVHDLMEDVGFKPDTSLEIGLKKFVAWYRNYHHCS